MIWTGSRGISRITDLQDSMGAWRPLEDLRGNRRSYHRVGESTMEDLLLFVNHLKVSAPVSLLTVTVGIGTSLTYRSRISLFLLARSQS